MLPICVQTIHVRELAAAVRFYQSALGYEVKATYGACIVQLKTGATTLILEEIEPGGEPAVPATLLSFETKDIQSDLRKVSEAGGTVLDASPRRCPVGRFAVFQDPSGVQHSLLQFD
ncbi:VOC family protein [Ramlibacter pallidus]|uniref:VOC family protein n=1 Tax=Ramlibacter pallidus TaxID=2780087 RepID=A0ABR9S5R2_9BURK|nr:VOC family protein [Ramlibacter pallidus]MBE7368850.1 VOC family protein [Ramlibacter pallidus]